MENKYRKGLRWPNAMRFAPELAWELKTKPPQGKHALLINPFYPKDPVASFAKHVLVPTLALTSIAAATPPDWSVRIWDENLLQGHVPYDPFPGVVGITAHLTFARRAYALARWYRDRGARVVLGGLHVTSRPDEAAPHADALAIGEGVQLWERILRDVEQGCLQRRYHGSYRRPFRDDPAPRRDLVPRGAFLTTTSLIATRGCHNRCSFCYLATDGLQMPYMARDVEQVVAEFAADRQPFAVFTDNNFGSKREHLRLLCRGLAKLGKIWSAAVTVDVTDDPDLVREMALSGCVGVFVGFESLTGENLDDAHKKTPRPEDYARRVEIFHRFGIQVNGSFVFGFDHDGPDVFERTLRWIEQSRLENATFHILTPYPGTPLFRQMEREGRLLHRNWDLYDTAHAVFRPKLLSPEQLELGYAHSYRELFSLESIWRRRPDHAAAVLPYLAMSLLYKKCNWLWSHLIRHRWIGAFWRPLIVTSLIRHRFHCLLVEMQNRRHAIADGNLTSALELRSQRT